MAQTNFQAPNSKKGHEATVASAVKTLKIEAEGLLMLAAAVNLEVGDALAKAVEFILNTKGRVIVTGLGKSGHIGRKISATLASTGTPAFFMHAAEASHGDLGMITDCDVVLALSWSGEQPEMKNLVSYVSRFGIALIAMTANAHSTLGAAADIVLALPRAPEACPHNLAPTTSSLMLLALGDALAVALLESRGFSSVDFGLLHPGGKLGAMLKYARDLMHVGDAVPLRSIGTRMSDALIEMSSKGFGCVGIVDMCGDIVGVVTDGDLRRHMRADLMDALVDDVMTKNPKTVASSVLAGEVLNILNVSKITAVLVTDGNKPVGIIHMHDLLHAGVV